ncbi:MAG TPA: aminotransferase class I/II-fold pyridoxal phosphate-dependent enzyme [Spirochaetales bacterium]|nr:aminotransferase class I/II-fold pyridoxal phosphate-dependent enzyme [Spirochaetales bacterium]
MDIFQKCYDFDLDKQVIAKGIYPYFMPLDGMEGTEATFEGRKIIMVGSNNYLGLTTHPKVKAAAMKGLEEYGPSCTGSRFLNGSLKLHQELEERLAAFVGKEAALVFSTGMQTNLGAISALIGRNDVVITDKDDHASIVDACRLGMGEIKRYVHGDLDQLDRILSKIPADQGTMVVVDGVFSMGGDIVDLPKLSAICKKYGTRLYVDDAHAIGVLGGGRGTAAHFNMTKDVDLIMGTFSKSFASLGGFVAGDAAVINYIKHTARSFIFSASLPAPNAMAAAAALEIMETEPWHVEKLWENGKFMLQGLKQLGFNTGATQTPIIPIIIGEDELCFRFWKELFDGGLYCNAVVSPAVPEGMALLRTSYMATHTREQLERVLDIFEKAGKKLGII